MSENTIIDTEAPMAGACSPLQLRPIPGETLDSFEGFMCYFNLGHNRTLKGVAEKLNLNISTSGPPNITGSTEYWNTRPISLTPGLTAAPLPFRNWHLPKSNERACDAKRTRSSPTSSCNLLRYSSSIILGSKQLAASAGARLLIH